MAVREMNTLRFLAFIEILREKKSKKKVCTTTFFVNVYIYAVLNDIEQ